jgi:glycosyltransferase involved in cell wall biosynthesis
LLVVGGGDGEPAFRKRIERDDLAGRVQLLTEYLSARELAVLYHRASALLFCSLHEGQGRVLYEAMACGTPVIGSDLGPIPEMLEHERNGLLVDPFDVDAMAGAFARFGSGELRRDAFEAACRETALRFDLAAVNPLEAQLYLDVLSGALA